VAGGSLESYLAGGLPSLAEAARLVETLAQTVAHLHVNGLIHGDLKPANILLQTEDGSVPTEDRGGTSSQPERPNLLSVVPKIADFELAQSLAGETTLPGRKGILGTPGYMAPEQAQGGGTGIGPAADIYALGAILYRLLTGRPPFREKTPKATLERVLSEEPVTPCCLNSQLPTALEIICLRCLEREPQRRYPSAEALAQDLQSYLLGVEAGRGQPLTRVRPAA
jgi:eukaryotic-like serine/threonine-protein kinase